MRLMRIPSLLFCAVALLGLLMNGCSSHGPVGGINVSVVDFRPIDASLLESNAKLTLRYTNENIAPLGFSGSHHKLYLNGSYVGTAVNDKPFGLPPLSSETQDVTIHLENLSLIKQLVAVRDRQSIAYRLDSVLFQTIGDEKSQVKTSFQGALDLRALAGSAP